ncbi:unnamed protein product, partial [Ectocarpus fasciculatus]
MERARVAQLGGRRSGRGRKRCFLWLFVLSSLQGAAGFVISHTALAQASRACWYHERTCGLKASSSSNGGEAGGDSEGDQDGSDLMSELMGEVNQRESLRRREGVRLLKRPSALLPPHTVLEHVLTSLQNLDFPTEGAGWRKA